MPRSGRVLEPRVQEIFESIMGTPHVAEELDELGAMEIARLEALIEAIDDDIAKRRRARPTKTRVLRGAAPACPDER